LSHPLEREPADHNGDITMATIIIAALVIVPIALLVVDLFRGKDRRDATHRSHGAQLNES
jgi:hypothetical protein